MTYNCIDRYLADRPDQPALIYESNMTNTSKVYTFKELHENVSKLAGAFRKLGVK